MPISLSLFTLSEWHRECLFEDLHLPDKSGIWPSALFNLPRGSTRGRIRTHGTWKDSNPRYPEGFETTVPKRFRTFAYYTSNLRPLDKLSSYNIDYFLFFAFCEIHYLCKKEAFSIEIKTSDMKILGNIIWLIFGGFGIAVEYFIWYQHLPLVAYIANPCAHSLWLFRLQCCCYHARQMHNKT